MRYASKRKSKYVLPALAAAGLGALLGVPAAHGDFVVTLTTIVGPVDYAGDVAGSGPQGAGLTEYVLSALNNGTNGTGTNLLAADVTINTNAPMVIDTTSDDDADHKVDANISGAAGFATAGTKVGKSTIFFPTVQPTFGQYNAVIDPNNGFDSTFVGVAVPDANPANMDNNAYANSSWGITSVQLGANIGTSNNNVYLSSQGQGGVDPAFLNGSVTSMRVVGAFASASFKGPAANQSAVPFANVVIPSSAKGSVTFSLAGDLGGPSTPFTIQLGAVVTPNPAMQLAGTALAGTTPIGSITIQGGHGSYVAQTVAVTGAATTAGALTVAGFTPGDEQIYGLATTSTESLASLISQLNAAVGSADAGATAVAVSSLSSSLQGVLAGDNIAVLIPNGVGGPNNVFSYVLGGTTAGDAAVHSITVVPEPTGIGALVLGGIGLLSRRKRRSA